MIGHIITILISKEREFYRIELIIIIVEVEKSCYSRMLILKEYIFYILLRYRV